MHAQQEEVFFGGASRGRKTKQFGGKIEIPDSQDSRAMDPGVHCGDGALFVALRLFLSFLPPHQGVGFGAPAL